MKRLLANLIFLIFLPPIFLPLFVIVQAKAATIPPQGGHTFKDHGGSITNRPGVDIKGPGVTYSDDAANNEMDFNIDPAGIPATAYYVAGHRYPGELQNTTTPAWIIPKVNNHLTCDGVDDAITVSDHADLEPSTISLSQWIYPMSDATGVIIAKDNNNQYKIRMDQGTANDNLVGYTFINNGVSVGAFSGSAPLFTWTLIIITASSTETRFYINGQLDSIISYSFTMPASANGLEICHSPSSSYANVRLDDQRIYSGVLSQSDITSIYNSGSGVGCGSVTTNLALCFAYDEISGTAEEDDGPLGTDQDGTLSGFSSPPTATSGWAYCKLSGCLMLDGTNDQVTVLGKDGASGGWSAFTLEKWATTNTIADGAVAPIYDKRNAAGTTVAYLLQANPTGAGNGGKLRFTSTGIFDYQTDSAVLTAGTLHHILVTYDNALACGSGSGNTGLKGRIYVDGVEKTITVNSCTGGSIPTVTDRELTIGRQGTGSPAYLTGKLDDGAIWTQALTSSTTPTIAQRYNGGSGSACPSSGNSILFCFHYNDGVTYTAYSTLADQEVWPASAGSDSSNCQSEANKCRSLQHVLDIIPKLRGGSATIYLASGTSVESDLMDGYIANGPYYYTFYAYTNPMPNSFSDVAALSGTSTGSNTGNFPKDTRSLFNDTTLSQFTSSDTEQLLEVTSGLSYCTASGYDYRNWFRIEKNQSASQLSIVTKFSSLSAERCGFPGGNTTYKIYRNEDQGTIHAGNRYNYSFQIKNSTGIKIQKFRVKGARKTTNETGHGIDIQDSIIEELSSITADYNYRGVNITKSRVRRTVAGDYSDNTLAGYRILNTATSDFVDENIANRNGSVGFTGYFSSQIRFLKANLAKANLYANFDFEQNFNNYGFEYNRADCDGTANCINIIISGDSEIDITAPNTITGGTSLCSTCIGPLIQSYSTLGVNTNLVTMSDVEFLNLNVAINLDSNGSFSWEFLQSTFTGTTYRVQDRSVFVNGNNYGQWVSDFRDEFMIGSVTSGDIGDFQWYSSLSGTGASVDVGTPVSGHWGIFNCTTGTTATGSCYIGAGTGTINGTNVWTGDDFELDIVIKSSNADANINLRIGLFGTVANPPATGIYFERLSTDTNWAAVTKNGATCPGANCTKTDTGSALTTNWVLLSIRKTGSTVEYYVNGANKTVVNTTVPADAELIVIYQASSTTTAEKTLNIDYVGLRGVRSKRGP